MSSFKKIDSPGLLKHKIHRQYILMINMIKMINKVKGFHHDWRRLLFLFFNIPYPYVNFEKSKETRAKLGLK